MLVLLSALACAVCLRAIGTGREVLAVEMGCLGLLTLLAAWLIALPAALGRP